MKSFALSNEEAAFTGWNRKWIVDFNDLVAAGETTSTTLDLQSSIAARSKAENIGFNVVTPFDGGATSELLHKVGYDLSSGTDDDDAFIASGSIHADSTVVPTPVNPDPAITTETVDETYGTHESTVVADLRTEMNILLRRVPRYFTVAWDLAVVYTATGANLSALTTGEVHYYGRIVEFASAKF